MGTQRERPVDPEEEHLVRELGDSDPAAESSGPNFRPARRRSSGPAHPHDGGAVSIAKATSSSKARQLRSLANNCGPVCSCRRPTLRARLSPAPTTATALSATLARRGGNRWSSEPPTPRWWPGGQLRRSHEQAAVRGGRIKVRGRRLEKRSTSILADRSGGFTSTGLKSLSRLAKVKRVTAKKATSLSLKLAKLNSRDSRRTVFVASPGNTAAMASAAMGAARASGSLLAVDRAASTKTTKWIRKNAEANHRGRRQEGDPERIGGGAAQTRPAGCLGPHPALSADRRPGSRRERQYWSTSPVRWLLPRLQQLAKRSCSCRPRPAMPRRCGSYRPTRRSPRYAQ